MTLTDIENLEKDFLTPSDIAPILHTNHYSISIQARTDPSKLGFPVIVIGNRTLIPKLGFLRFCRGDLHE